MLICHKTYQPTNLLHAETVFIHVQFQGQDTLFFILNAFQVYLMIPTSFQNAPDDISINLKSSFYQSTSRSPQRYSCTATYFHCNVYLFKVNNVCFHCSARSAAAVEYTECISAAEQDFPTVCPGYDTKKTDGKAPVMPESWGMWSSVSLPLLQGPLWLGAVVPDLVLSMGKIELWYVNCVQTNDLCWNRLLE